MLGLHPLFQMLMWQLRIVQPLLENYLLQRGHEDGQQNEGTGHGFTGWEPILEYHCVVCHMEAVHRTYPNATGQYKGFIYPPLD